MVIAKLPVSTIQFLGSSQVITTSAYLVKELLDNAIDAKATSVDVIISHNTLDKIEVRDNGEGISVADLDALGRRGHTSKLKSFEELKNLGGMSLGFRGEALWSAVQLGEVSVTTKTDGELSATAVRLKVGGGIDCQYRASHPIGTTVSVSNLLTKLPVRKQSALKEAPKTLAKIKELLQAYALARPSIKLCLRITKGNKGVWSFAPRPKGGIRDAVSQVIGRDAAMQCFEKSVSFPESQSGTGNLITQNESAASPNLESIMTPHWTRNKSFLVEAFLPKPDADPTKVGHGQYLAVDSRPLSSEKGTMKKIVTTFKRYISNVYGDATEKLKNPFLRLNIICPIASYDLNIEPAKDEVLFGNEPFLLEIVETLFKAVYGELKAKPVGSLNIEASEKLHGFDQLLARKPKRLSLVRTLSMSKGVFGALPTTPVPVPPPITLRTRGNSITTEDGLTANALESIDKYSKNKQRNWGFDMSKDFTEDVEVSQLSRRPSKSFVASLKGNAPLDSELSHVNSLNPWTIAKMIAPAHRAILRDSMALSGNFNAVLPATPKFSGTSLQQTTAFGADSEEALLPGTTDYTAPTFNGEEARNLQSSTIISPKWLGGIQNSHSSPLQKKKLHLQGDIGDEPEFVHRDKQLPCGSVNDFITARNIPEPSLLSPPGTQLLTGAQRSRSRNMSRRFPFKAGNSRPIQDVLLQPKLLPHHHTSRLPNDLHGITPQIQLSSDLAWAMDFEQRKEDATRQRREDLRDSRGHVQKAPLNVSQPSPHMYRPPLKSNLDAFQSSRPKHALAQVELHSQSAFPDDERRSYLIKGQKPLHAKAYPPGEPPKSKRVKTIMLPLEANPDDEQMHKIVQTVTIDLNALQETMMILTTIDEYVSHGIQIVGLSISASEAHIIARRLQDIVKIWMESLAENNYQVDYHAGNLLNFTELLGGDKM